MVWYWTFFRSLQLLNNLKSLNFWPIEHIIFFMQTVFDQERRKRDETHSKSHENCHTIVWFEKQSTKTSSKVNLDTMHMWLVDSNNNQMEHKLKRKQFMSWYVDWLFYKKQEQQQLTTRKLQTKRKQKFIQKLPHNLCMRVFMIVHVVYVFGSDVNTHANRSRFSVIHCFYCIYTICTSVWDKCDV